jgi:mono/diheme cytochrome c family protein
MKKVTLLSIIYALLIITIGCKEKSKQEEVITNQDSTYIENEFLDTLSTKVNRINEEVQEEISKEVKEPIVVKKLEDPKIMKEVVKTTTEVKKDVLKEEVVKKEVIIEKEVEKVNEVKKEVEAKVEKPKEIIAANSWIVPTKDIVVINPIEASKEKLKEAKIIYDIQCKSCHGAKGLGDGTKAKSMKGDLGDFSSAKFQAQTDGELFYKTKVGRADMPGYAKKLSDEDIWLTVLYMRSLKK